MRSYAWIPLWLFCASCAGGRAVPTAPAADPAAEWFLAQRAGDHGALPDRALALALARQRAAGTAGSWSEAGPTNVQGRVSSLAADPADPDRIWLGSANGGVFLSEDGGQTFVPKFDALTALSIGALAAHPTDSDVLWVGTGEEAGGGYSYDGEGVFVTSDGGTTWTSLGLSGVRRIGRIAVDPVDPQRLFVAAVGGLYHQDANRGVYRSLDGGTTWQNVLYVAGDTGAVDVAVDPTSPDRVYAATWQRYRGDGESYFGGAGSGIRRSLDGGDTWSPLTNGLPTGSGVGRIGLAIAPASPQTVYAVIHASGGELLGIWRSLDGGDSWAQRSNDNLAGSFSTFGYYFGQIRVDPADPDTVYVLDIQLWWSRNGGRSFTTLAGTGHVDQHALVVGPGSRLLLGNDGGFYRSDDGGGTFAHASGLAITQFYDLCIDRLQPQRRFGGTQDNGTRRTTSGGLDDWTNVLGGDGMQCEVDPADSSRVYAESQWGGLARSTNGGDSFVGATAGIAAADRRNWVVPLTLDPAQPTTLYTGTYRVYRSTDAAVSWTPISGDLSNGPLEDHGQHPIQGTVTAVAVSPVDGSVLWAGTDDGNVWVSDDAGVSWEQVNPPGTAYWVTDVAPDPFDAQAAYLTTTGYRLDDTTPYVRRTEDLGATWIDLGAGLPQVPVNSLVADPSWWGRAYAGTDLAVWVSDDRGASWQRLGDGIPWTVVLDLVLHDGTRTLFAGTHGRSMYAFDLQQLGAPDGDGDGVDNNADCAPLDAGAHAAPAGVPSLVVSRGAGGAAVLAWADLSATSGNGTVYDVAGADATNLPSSGASLVCGTGETTLTDAAIPAPGSVAAYWVRARNACGSGSWGADGSGAPRAGPACP